MATFPFLRAPKQNGDIGSLGNYRVIRLLGDGAMGFVFLAEETALDRRVALKVMRPEFSATPEGRERFIREAKASAKVESDHVVTIYQVGEDNGAPFIAMELLEGMSLQSWLARRDKLPSFSSVFKVARDLFRGLGDAHRSGLIHRDIKPSNLWIEKRTGRIKILDFGLTKAGDGADNATRSGAILGTPAYMAPEQANGQTVDQRADLFSAGLVLHEVLTGKNPFRRGSILATLKAIGSEEAPLIMQIRPETPPALGALVDSLLQRDPGFRPSDIQAALTALGVAEQEYRSISGKCLTNSEDPPSNPVGIRAESNLVVTQDQGSDPGSFLFEDTLASKMHSKEKNRTGISSKVLWSVGAVLVSTLLILITYSVVKKQPAGEGQLALGLERAGERSGPKDSRSTTIQNLTEQKPLIAESPNEIKPPELPTENKKSIHAEVDSDALIQTVVEELKKRNPDSKPAVIGKGSNGDVACLLPGEGLKDLSPLAALNKVKQVVVQGGSQIADLSPLKGKPIEILTICNSKVADLTPLKGMPLKNLTLNSNQITSIEPAFGMPLSHLELTGNSGLASLSALSQSQVTNIRFGGTSVSSLEALRGKKISFLESNNCPIADLSPLAGMPLEVLNISGCKATSIEALRNCPISTLSMADIKVKDLSPLAGKKLKYLGLGDTSGSDLSVLKSSFVEEVNGLPEPIQQETLDAFPNTKTINKKERSMVAMAAKTNLSTPQKSDPTKSAQAKPDLVLDGHQHELATVQFSQDGKQVASAGLNGWHNNKDTIKVWNAANGFPGKSIEIYESAKGTASFTRDFKKVALGGHLKFSAWSMENSQKLFESDANLGGTGGASGLAFSPDGKLLAGGELGSLQVVDTIRWAVRLRWDAKTQYPNPEGLVIGSLTFSKDGRFFAFSIGKGQDLPTDVHLFDLVTRKLLRTLKGHTHGVSLAFSPNSKFLVSGSRDRTVQFWDLSKPSPAPKPAFVLKRAAIPPVHCIAWSPNGKLVAAGDNEGNITFFDGSDPNGFAEIPNLYMKKAHEMVVSSLDFSPDSKRLVTGGFDKKVKVWTLPERPAGN